MFVIDLSVKATYEFEMDGVRGISSKKEPHMHGLKLSLLSQNEIQQEWDYYKDGKSQDHSTVITLKRKK